MRSKVLLAKFSYNKLEAECKRKGWNIPSKEEVMSAEDATVYPYVWVTDAPPDEADRATHSMQVNTNTGKLILVNKSFMTEAIVLVPEFKNKVHSLYEDIVKAESDSYLHEGITRDKANRLANIYAVQNTWRIYNDYSRRS